MKITITEDWIFILNDNSKDLDNFKIGKWMVYFSESGKEYITKICEKAVGDNIVPEAKVAIRGDVACFYLNIDDIECHKKCIYFLIENNLIRKTKDGRFYNLSFKKDSQTINDEYGIRFIPKLRLEDFIDLYTGEWIFNDHTKEVDFYDYCQHYLSNLKAIHLSHVNKLEKTSLNEAKKKELRKFEYEEYNNEIHICQMCQNAYKRMNIVGSNTILVAIPDGTGTPLLTPICTERPLHLLKERFSKKRYGKKISAAKLQKKMKGLYISIYDINNITEIRCSSIETYLVKDCTISILNIALIAAVLKCNIEDLVE